MKRKPQTRPQKEQRNRVPASVLIGPAQHPDGREACRAARLGTRIGEGGLEEGLMPVGLVPSSQPVGRRQKLSLAPGELLPRPSRQSGPGPGGAGSQPRAQDSVEGGTVLRDEWTERSRGLSLMPAPCQAEPSAVNPVQAHRGLRGRTGGQDMARSAQARSPAASQPLGPASPWLPSYLCSEVTSLEGPAPTSWYQ